jgi:hypothetical protein
MAVEAGPAVIGRRAEATADLHRVRGRATESRPLIMTGPAR